MPWYLSADVQWQMHWPNSMCEYELQQNAKQVVQERVCTFQDSELFFRTVRLKS